MIFTKKMNFKLSVIGFIFITLIISINGILMDFGLKKSIEVTCTTHYESVDKEIRSDIELLKQVVSKLADNDKIVEILEKSRTVSDISVEEKEEVTSELESFQSYLENFTFLHTTNIVSKPGKYIFMNPGFNNDYDIMSRSWMKEEYLENRKDTIVTDIHNDIYNGKKSISIVNFIYSSNDDEFLGAAILNVYLDDLINNIESEFYMGDLNVYIQLDENEYYSRDGIVNEINYGGSNYIEKIDNPIGNGSDIYLQFDKESIVYYKEMKKINKFRIVIFSFAGVILVLALIRIMKEAFRPVIKSLDKLKFLLNNLDKSNMDLENIDEFKQLELISNSLGKSFDKKIQSLIYYDELTKLPNRKMLHLLCSEMIEHNSEFALIFIDLNRFKYINDVFGHSAGDDLLISFSNRLQRVLDKKGIVTRYSGDEFIIIYNSYEGDEELKKFYDEKILAGFNEPIGFNKTRVIVEFSAGVAIYPKDAQTFNNLIDKSDFMMYSAKKNSKNKKLLFFNDDIYSNIINIENIKEELKSVIDNDELVLYYQPIVNKNGVIKKVEALIRWNSKERGLVSPINFIPYAEDSGEIVKIGYWIIEEVFKNLGEFKNGDENIQASINVSPIQLMEVSFAENIKKIANKYNIDLSQICFEITESVVLEESIIVYDNIQLLSKFGSKLALDDFGTGYASFSYLKKYKLNILKIDRLFINGGGKVDYKIVNNIKNIAHLLDMETVVEGVETEEQFNILNEIGCDYFQGYYFSKPITLEELKKKIKSSLNEAPVK